MQESVAVLYSNPKQFFLHNGLQSAATLNVCPGCECNIAEADASAGVHTLVPHLTHSNAFKSNRAVVGEGVGTIVGVGDGAGVVGDGTGGTCTVPPSSCTPCRDLSLEAGTNLCWRLLQLQ
jgi:hypothetical protein